MVPGYATVIVLGYFHTQFLDEQSRLKIIRFTTFCAFKMPVPLLNLHINLVK